MKTSRKRLPRGEELPIKKKPANPGSKALDEVYNDDGVMPMLQIVELTFLLDTMLSANELTGD
jgi:hypothetical protein